MNKKKIIISAILIVKNEESKLRDCLKSIDWVDEIIFVNNDSIDRSVEIAKEFECRIFKYRDGTFPDRKNFGAKKARSKWLLFIDADERINSSLREELMSKIKSQMSKVSAYAIPRKNFILGREFKQSNQSPDYVIRLIKKDAFIGWEGTLHEQPKFRGELSYLKNPLIHLKHDNLHDMVIKTNVWSELEAKLMIEAYHPPMNIFRFLSAVLREFWLRFIKEKAFMDGSEGIIYGLYQIFSRFLSYAKLWEIQINANNQQLITNN